MQKLAAYLLEHNYSTGTDAQRQVEVQLLEGLLREWLKNKRADDPEANSGEFRSESKDAIGEFSWDRANDGTRSWRLLRLNEEFANGRKFETSVSITETAMSIAVFVTLAGGLARSAVTPVPAEAKTPRFVRQILATHNEWRHGATKMCAPRRVEGTDAGESLAREILSPSRTLPIIALSEDDGELTFPDLDNGLGKELAGLANVTVLDELASWALTEVLGKDFSCYWGAVRLYWPRFASNRHPLWTARRLIESDVDTGDFPSHFQAQLRRLVMRVSAASVVRPRVIDEIRNAAALSRLEAIRSKLTSELEWKRMYEEENDRLRVDNRRLEEEVERMRLELQTVEYEQNGPGGSEQTIEPDSATEKDTRPPKGTTCYYKKKSGYKRDVMIEIGDCGHNTWKNANKADKAKKAIKRLVGSDDWKNIHKCGGSCDGGGVYRVAW